MFAIKTKTPILPCYIVKKQKAFSKNILLIGEPFELAEFYGSKIDKDVLNNCSQILIEKLNNLKQEYEKMIEEKAIVKRLKKEKKD